MNSRSNGDLRKVYRYSRNISRSRDRILMMICTAQNRGASADRARTGRIENLRQRLTRLSLLRHDEIMRVYSNVTPSRNASPSPRRRTRSRRSQRQRPTTASNEPLRRIRALTPDQPESPPHISPEPSTPPRTRSPTPRTQSPAPRTPSPIPRTPSPTPQLKVTHIVIEPEKTIIDMVPVSFEPAPTNDDGEEEEDEEDDDKDDENDIVYPDGIVDRHPYIIVARYRRAIKESTDFRQHPLLVAENSTETLMLGLESFARQHGCDLSFTDEDHRFDKSIYRATGGVIDLGSVHLLASDSLLTANFQFEIDLDYDRQITQSKKDVKQFVGDFCHAISQDLSCDKSNVRVFSIDKLGKKSGKSHVNFGLIAPDQKKTERLADTLQAHASSGFSTDTILKHVKQGKYECIWKPVLKYLKIRPSDLDPDYNNDYRPSWMPKELTRGSKPYYLPLGWYRFGLNVQGKYVDDIIWLGDKDVEGEWPVAFHGTKADAVSGIIQHGLLPSTVKRDAMLGEAIAQMGEEADQPGLYVATHCNGGSDIYTEPFTVTAFPGQSEQFRIVFQCRVQPGKYTTHTRPVDVGQAWRIVDRKAVRPYGILLKKDV